jgi:hypothetical protein
MHALTQARCSPDYRDYAKRVLECIGAIGVEQLQETRGVAAEILAAVGQAAEERLATGAALARRSRPRYSGARFFSAAKRSRCSETSSCWPRSQERRWTATTSSWPSTMRTGNGFRDFSFCGG